MRIIARSTLRAFWLRHRDAEQPLLAWFRDVKRAGWRGPADVKRQYAAASFVGDNRVVFNIAGNKYRLVVHFNYAVRAAYICFVGTHADYDKIDVEAV